MADMKIVMGGTLKADAAAFLAAWHRAEAGDTTTERVLAFESWGLAHVMTGERYRLLRHLHAQPAASVSALARDLSRQYRRVHADVAALETVGLIDRSGGKSAPRQTGSRRKLHFSQPWPSSTAQSAQIHALRHGFGSDGS